MSKSEELQKTKIMTEFTVTIYYPCQGNYVLSSLTFRDEKKARDYYTDMLLKYPNYNVEFQGATPQ